MKNLWAPWRMGYIKAEKPQACVFCIPEQPDLEADRELLVLWRGKHVYAMLNRYPYAPGHLLLIPYRHAADLTDLNQAEAAEMMDAIRLSCLALRAGMQAQGLNVGLNLGEAAGAGICCHMHFHVVPRWIGDSQFIAVMDEVRVIPQALDQTWQALRPHFPQNCLQD